MCTDTTMACKRQLADQDPDYESIPFHIQQKKLRKLEQEAKEATEKKIEKIIRNQFMQEIVNKENELEQVTQQLFQARTLLDRLRAYIVMKYYATGGQNPAENASETYPSSSAHPTAKKYVGKMPVSHTISPAIQNKEWPCTSTSKANSSQITSSSSTSRVQDTELLSQRGQESQEKQSNSISRGGRLKEERLIIVGNSSRYIPTSRREGNERATHKWMVYVRGGKENPRIDDVVKKVIFFLHPSYRPNDLVEVCHPPFHLVRHGWGEFRIRVQLHFHDQRNKPEDILHDLKLNRGLSGLMEPGSETHCILHLFKPDNKFKNTLENTSNHEKPSNLQSASLLVHQPARTVATDDAESKKDVAENGLVTLNEPNQKLKSIPYFDGTELLPNGDTQLFEHPANDVEEEVVVSSDVLSDTIIPNIKQETMDIDANMTTEITCSASIKQEPNATIMAQNPLASNILTLKPQSKIDVSQSPVPSCLPSSSSSTSPSLVMLNMSSIPSQEEMPLSTAILTPSKSLIKPPYLQSSSVASSSVLKPNIVTSPFSSSTTPKLPTLSQSSLLQGTTNGLKTFVRCVDKKGQVILVPCDSLLKSQPAVSPSTALPMSTLSAKEPNFTKRSLIKPALAKPLKPATTIVNGAQISATSNPTSSPITTSPSYLVGVLPNPVGGPGQLIFIPDTSAASQSVQSLVKTEASFSGGQGTTKRQNSTQNSNPNPTNVQKEQKVFYTKLVNKCPEDLSVHQQLGGGKSQRREDALGDLQRAIDSIRLNEYETFPLLLKKVVKLHPLVTPNPDRSCHPYCAPSAEVYYSWNIGKRRAAEWSRAVAMKQTLLQLVHKHKDQSKWTEKDVWSSKRIMIWCKRHGYTPLAKDYLDSGSSASNAPRGMSNIATKTDPKDLIEALEKQHSALKGKDEHEEEIDIVSIDDDKSTFQHRSKLKESPEKSNKALMMYLPVFSKAAQFVKEKAQEVGVNIKPVEIFPSVFAPIVEEIILTACKQFVCDILRSALNEGFERQGGKRCPDTIELQDVVKGVLRLPFCDLLTNENLGVAVSHEIIQSHLQPL